MFTNVHNFGMQIEDDITPVALNRLSVNAIRNPSAAKGQGDYITACRPEL